MASYNSEAPVLDTDQAVVFAYCDFLTVAIHTILSERNLYPPTSFIKARKYNYPVRQSRHPKLCKWIQDAVAAVEFEMLKVRYPTEYSFTSCLQPRHQKLNISIHNAFFKRLQTVSAVNMYLFGQHSESIVLR